MSEDKAEPIFRFIRDEEQSSYNLSLESAGEMGAQIIEIGYAGKTIDLRKNSVDIICMSPCLIRDDHSIIFVSDVEGSKLKPFLSKENILIPKKAEIKYFSSFVLNTINNFKVESIGFEIIEIIPDKDALLDLETGLIGKTGLTLRYNYQGIKIYANEPSGSFTLFEKNGEKFIFRKYFRDFKWEKRCRETLGELGFFSDDDIIPLHQITNEWTSCMEF